MVVLKGGKWTSTLYFDSHAGHPSSTVHRIQKHELIKQLGTLVDLTANIRHVHAYKTPLVSAQLTTYTAYHLFIYFETNEWNWTIEKDGEGITIQRSESRFHILYCHKGDKRGKPFMSVKSDISKRSVGDLILWLKTENELDKSYHFLIRNCKTFAKRVFDYLANTKKLYWFNGAFSQHNIYFEIELDMYFWFKKFKF